MKHAHSISVLILLSALFSAPSYAQLDIFLKLEGIQGESVDEEHRDEIDVLGWGWQLSNPGTTHTGGGGGAAVSEIGDISIIKISDLASPALYLAVMRGQRIPEAVLTLRRTNQQDGGRYPYLVITMTEVLVTSARPGGSAGDTTPVEQITLNFARISIEYHPQNPDGSAGAKVEVIWDILANTQG
ncbi:MAG: type VI secretion system tube protein Hcp [Rhodothermales bacterium]|nr:type VI secretion system tube protein Hcp [Rhodothermales bacterium]